MRAIIIASQSVPGIGAAAFAIILATCSGSRLGAQDAKSAEAQLTELQKQAAAGDAPAMFALAQRYRHGQGTTIDLGKAAEWYGKAAQKDHAAAMTQLGRTSIQDLQPVLRLSGQAVATPAAPESGRTYDRKLSLQLAWTGGSGPAIPHTGKPFVIALSADGNQWTTQGYTRAAPYAKSVWELTPTSVRQEEIAVDTIRETTMFRASRQTTLAGFGAPGFPIPVTEQIEVKHVHFPRLVPRG